MSEQHTSAVDSANRRLYLDAMNVSSHVEWLRRTLKEVAITLCSVSMATLHFGGFDFNS